MNWYPTIIAALIIAGGAFFAAKQGGKMAAKASRESVRETLEAQEQRDEKRQKELVLGVLQAIEEELQVLWKLYVREFGASWKNFEEGKEDVFYVRVLISQDISVPTFNRTISVGYDALSLETNPALS